MSRDRAADWRQLKKSYFIANLQGRLTVQIIVAGKNDLDSVVTGSGIVQQPEPIGARLPGSTLKVPPVLSGQNGDWFVVSSNHDSGRIVVVGPESYLRRQTKLHKPPSDAV